MKASDYIVSFLAEKGISDVFGYPGGMVTHLMDSFGKYADRISAHINYHEQASAFCACGYASVAHLPGVAYATSGPGATNLVTGLANAYFDSVPCIFITGQVNTYAAKEDLAVRQKGFQETDIVGIVKPIIKYAVRITEATRLRHELEKAFAVSMRGRPGPVLLDIPMNIFRADINPAQQAGYQEPEEAHNYAGIMETLLSALLHAKKPLILAGAGIREAGVKSLFQELVDQMGIPVVTSMIGVDLLPTDSEYCFGFLGAYGHRNANFLVAKSDFILSVGSRMDCRQTGENKAIFAENAKLFRIDIDKGEVTNQIKAEETDLICDISQLLPMMKADGRFRFGDRFRDWLRQCDKIRKCLQGMDLQMPNNLVQQISKYIPDDTVITTDVGQNQVWIAQSFHVRAKQTILFSGGLGAMGYSLPAAIGAYYASRRSVICFVGDGGFQMNLQELQFLAREQIPVKIILLNNRSLGMIRQFQEMYFDSNFVQTTNGKGYAVPDFCKVAEAYGIASYRLGIKDDFSVLPEILKTPSPAFVDVDCGDCTYVFPKLAMGKPIQDQEPLLRRDLFDSLMKDKI